MQPNQSAELERSFTQRGGGWKLFGNALIVVGLIGLGLGIAFSRGYDEPIWVSGFDDDLGTIDGDKPYPIRFLVTSMRPAGAKIVVKGPGCTMSEKPLTQNCDFLVPTETTYLFTPERLPDGPGEQIASIQLLQDGKPYEVLRKFRFVVKRETHAVSVKK